MRNVLIISGTSTLGPRLAVLFGEAVESLGGAVFLEEVCYRGPTFSVLPPCFWLLSASRSDLKV